MSNPYPKIQSTRVDIEALHALSHNCVPEKCIGRDRGCCSTYEVYVDPVEMGAIVGAMPDAALRAPGLKEKGAFIGPFEDTDGGSCLATDEDGLCVFSYKDKQGATLCSLHSAALEMGLPPVRVKPTACALWPLYIVEGDEPLLTVQPGVLDFPCNRRRRTGAGGLNPGIAEIVAMVFGDSFLQEVEALLH